MEEGASVYSDLHCTKADKKLVIYYKLNKTDNEKNWKKKVVEVPKLDYYLDTEDLYITFSPGKHSMIKSSCKLLTEQQTSYEKVV